MAVTSTMLPLGTPAPDFTLPDTASGRDVSLSDYGDKDVLLVMFIANHCPYVKHLKHALAELGEDYADSALGIVAISSNDIESYPDDSPQHMAAEAEELGYRFSYLFDETQEIAAAYTAMCTPDFFLFDRDRKLAYRGRFDETRPNTIGKVTGGDLRAAIEASIAGTEPATEQYPSMGCSIKWKQGNVPEYFATAS